MFKSINRKNTSSYKYDHIEGGYLSFFIADSDYASPKCITDALIKRAKHPIYGYTFIDDAYYQSVINWIKRRYHYTIEKHHLIPTSGIVNSLFYALLMLKDYSDSVVIQTPVYNQFYGLIESAGFKMIENKLINNEGYFTMDLQDLEETFKKGTKILILCSPHNPVGRVYTHDELQALVLLAKQYNVYILSDEIHCDIILNGYKFISLNHFYPLYENIITFFSPSKSFNIAGLKTSSTIILNETLNKKYKALIDKHHYGLKNPFSIEGAKAAYTCDQWLDDQNKHLTNNYKIMQEYFKKHKEVVLTKMEATYLAWLDLSCLDKSCEVMYEELLSRGILVSGGKKYADYCEGFIRINFACDEQQLRKGLDIVSEYIEDSLKEKSQ